MANRYYLPFTAILITISSCFLSAQLTLIKPIYPDNQTLDSNPRLYTFWKGKMYFAASGFEGNGLWETDGTKAGTRPLLEGLEISRIIPARNILYVVVNIPQTLLFELWVTDGTTDGSKKIHENYYDFASRHLPYHRSLVKGDSLYFVNYSQLNYDQLFVSDGTEAGTRLFTHPQLSGNKYPVLMNILHNKLFFQTFDRQQKKQFLWQVDHPGSDAKIVWEAASGIFPTSIASFNNYLWFFGQNDSVWGLWRLSPNNGNTRFIVSLPESMHANLISFANYLYIFTASAQDINRSALWKSNGEKWNLSFVKEFPWPHFEGGRLHAFQNQLYIHSYKNLYISDGSSPATLPVVKADSSISPKINDLFDADNHLFYVLDKELWHLSEHGTVKRRLVQLKNYGEYSHRTLNGKLLISYEDSLANYGKEPYLLKPDDASLTMLKDIYPTPAPTYASMFQLTDSVLFYVAENHLGRELWKTDGTTNGTGVVQDIYPGKGSSMPRAFVQMGTKMYFTANDTNGVSSLWRMNIDGSELEAPFSNTRMPSYYPDGYRDKAVYKDQLLFIGWKGFTFIDDYVEVFVTDGTDLGTRRITCSPYLPESLFATQKGVFAIGGPYDDRELYFADSSLSRFKRVLDIDPFVGSGMRTTTPMLTDGQQLYFTPHSDSYGEELYHSDGSESGTRLIKDIWPGTYHSQPRGMTLVNEKIFFSARSPLKGRELWISDGTRAGTKEVKEFFPGELHGINWGNRREKIAFRGKFFFTAQTDNEGTELWQSDGTASGTHLVKNILPEDASSHPHYLTVFDSLLYFVASDSAGREHLWVTNGTEVGTIMLTDAEGQPFPSKLSNLIAFKDKIFFTGIHPTLGTSLYAFDAQISVPSDTTKPLDAATPEGLYVWPNPTDAILNVSLGTDEEGPYAYELIDLKARKVLSGLWEKQLNDQTWELDLSGLSGGMYLLIVRVNSRIYHKKVFIK